MFSYDWVLRFWGFLKYILGVRLLSDMWFASVFSQAMACLFILLFQRTEVLNSDKAQFKNCEIKIDTWNDYYGTCILEQYLE